MQIGKRVQFGIPLLTALLVFSGCSRGAREGVLLSTMAPSYITDSNMKKSRAREKRQARGRAYLSQNYAAVRADIAKGEGQDLQAIVATIQPLYAPDFIRVLRQNYQQFPANPSNTDALYELMLDYNQRLTEAHREKRETQ